MSDSHQLSPEVDALARNLVVEGGLLQLPDAVLLERGARLAALPVLARQEAAAEILALATKCLELAREAGGPAATRLIALAAGLVPSAREASRGQAQKTRADLKTIGVVARAPEPPSTPATGVSLLELRGSSRP